MNRTALTLGIVLSCFLPLAALAQQIPAPLTGDQITPPLGSNDVPSDIVDLDGVVAAGGRVIALPRKGDVIRPPVRMPKRGEVVRPPLPMPERGDVQPPRWSDVQPPLPPPDAQLPAPIPSPWEMTPEAAEHAEWQPARCYIKQRGSYRELRCQMPEEGGQADLPRRDEGKDEGSEDRASADDSSDDADRADRAAGGDGADLSCATAGQSRLLDLVNRARQDRGLGPVSCSNIAASVARSHSSDMCSRGYFSHRSPEGAAPWDRLRAAGASFSGAGENIAKGYADADSVHAGWMASPGHRNNILNPEYTRMGIGRVQCNGSVYWTQLFVR